MLKLKKIKFEYKNNEVVLDELDFAIEKNEIVSVIGPSGAGKTTLVNLIAGYLSEYKGEVIISGEVKNYPSRKCIVINQENDLFPWLTVEKQLWLVRKEKEKNNELLKLVNLYQYKNKLPQELSGGMKKRLSFARALASETDFIIMDEPFSSQDVAMKEKLHQDLLDIARRENKTILLVTHDLDEAIFLSNRILVLGGTPAKIIGEHKMPFDKNDLIQGSEVENLKNQLRSIGYNI
jgi:ABC-type nitrate/sulfonate/bicarbonate transport system ATPase subunit